MEKRIVFLISAALVILIVSSICWQCWAKKHEGFTDGGESAGFDLSSLTSSEKELFTKMKDNALDDKEIDKLIGSGALTSEVMEKFLTILGSTPAGDLVM